MAPSCCTAPPRARRAVRWLSSPTVTSSNSTSRRPGSFAEEGLAEALARDAARPPSHPPGAGGPHYRLIDRRPEGAGSRVVVSCAGRELSLYLPLPGEAAAIDLVAALAAQEGASREALSSDRIEKALANVRLSGRGSLRTLAGDVLVLDDTYNANPSSMRAALATLAELAGTRRKVAVLGEMKELGVFAENEHVALGDAVAEAGVTLFIGCGGLMDRALDRAASRGVEVVRCESTDGAATAASARVVAGDAVLVKGSRSVGTEAVITALERGRN